MANVGITAATGAYLFSSPSEAYLREGVTHLVDRGTDRLTWAVDLAKTNIAEDASQRPQEEKILEAWWRWYDEAITSMEPLALPAQRTALQPVLTQARTDLERAYLEARQTLTP